MPVIIYKKDLEVLGQRLCFAFDCEYDKNNCFLKLKNCTPNYFDSGDFGIKIEEAINELNEEKINFYSEKNNGVLYLGILDYFVERIPGLYSIKFESKNDDSIYYSNELK